MWEIPPKVKARQEDERKVCSKKRDALREVEAIKLRERRRLEEEEAEERDRITQEKARLDQERARGRTETGILVGQTLKNIQDSRRGRGPVYKRESTSSTTRVGFNGRNVQPVIMKKALPPTFHGMENEDYERHLKQFNTACALNNEIMDVEKIALFPFTLKGDAAEWFYDQNATYTTFAALSDDFKGYYKKKYECRDPVVRLQEIYQGDTELAEDYARMFNKIYGRCDATTVPDVLAMNWFLNGLRSEMQTPVRLEAPTTLDTARAAAEKVDKILRKTSNALRRELRTKGGVDCDNNNSSSNSALGNLSDSRTKIINNFDFQPHLNPSSYQDQKGHYATTCPNEQQNKGKAPQLAVRAVEVQSDIESEDGIKVEAYAVTHARKRQAVDEDRDWEKRRLPSEKVMQRLSPKKSDTLITIKDEPMTCGSQLEESRQQGDPSNEELGERLVELIMERPVTLTVGELITVAPYLRDHLYNMPDCRSGSVPDDGGFHGHHEELGSYREVRETKCKECARRISGKTD
ncbi:hypothetical protein SELMODRAFT_407273 [Selaginella moellendorffii]|uniref:Ty3 transposon capsid-like protein domain-containing protein n=1 Tax=Selaginella moellendorffii TaxID=88036 RepID=D8R4H5_SELML|nr:hypothetical protein SELMODRAFT_407273 [Selaginella moellendorffii]